jgi:hypothetical protein
VLGSLFKNRRSEVERRSDDERRQLRDAPPVVDRRQHGERRAGGDRRALAHGVAVTTPGPISRISDWLDEYCEGRFSVGLDAIDERLQKKRVRVMFELEQDKLKFMSKFAGKR